MPRSFPLFLFFFSLAFGQNDVVILSPKVGTEIDIHENRFYRIFPRMKGFINAQIIAISNKSYRVRFVTSKRRKQRTFDKPLSLKRFVAMQNYINGQPEFTKEARIAMYSGMNFLRAAEIISDLPKPQFVKILHHGRKHLKGTLISFQDTLLNVQTPVGIEKISLKDVETISYRLSADRYLSLKPYIYAVSGIIGLSVAQLYNKQRSPRVDVSWYFLFYGTMIGLNFSSELFDAITTLLTPEETFILSQERYEKNRTQ
ncbi:MAG: hypothetical protein VX600_05175 [Candidatus Neomarinimicrobiota bacterium]|jgi:hypothetical protein|nr:hypothetical protein [Candidatus Neomarinimicrobiota bacterium]